MAITVADILQIRTMGLYNARVQRNVYHYSVDAVTGTPEFDELIEDWWVLHAPYLRGVTTVSFSWREVLGETITGDRDFSVFAIPLATQPGLLTVSVADVADHRAGSIRFTLATRAIRSGWKRYGAFPSNWFGNYGSTLSAALTAYGSLGGFLSAPHTLEASSGSVSLIPVVLGRRNTPTPGTLVTAPITGYQVSARETTQNTRKAGRGE